MLNAVSHYLVSAHIIAQIEWMSRLIGLSAGRQGGRRNGMNGKATSSRTGTIL